MISRLLDRVLLTQAAVVVCRPIVFVLSVGYLSGADWATWYLVALGLMPMFAVADVMFQSAARHAFITNIGLPRISAALWLVVSAILVISAVAIRHSYLTTTVEMAVMALLLTYSTAAFFNRFEASVSSSRAVLYLAAAELIGYVLCALVVFLGFHFAAAVLATLIFPLSRMIVIMANRHSQPDAPSANLSATARTSFVGSAVSSQVFASAAAGAPSIVILLVPTAVDQIGRGLIFFKLVFAVSALCSTVVNILGVRIFYGVIRLDMGSDLSLAKAWERMFFVFSTSFAALAGVLVMLVDLSEVLYAVGLCIAFSYLNLLSSLAFMRGRPLVSAQAQATVCAGAFALAFLINGEVGIASALFFLLLGGLFLVPRKSSVASMLAG